MEFIYLIWISGIKVYYDLKKKKESTEFWKHFTEGAMPAVICWSLFKMKAHWLSNEHLAFADLGQM